MTYLASWLAGDLGGPSPADSPIAAAAIARLYGEDIWYDIAAPDVTLGEADYVVTAAGDLEVVTGREALRQSLLRRYVTNPGEWPTLPEYGAGVRMYVKAKNTPAVRAELESALRAQTMRDPRVQSVTSAVVEQLDDGSDGIKVSVIVVPKGRLRSDRPLPVTIEVR